MIVSLLTACHVGRYFYWNYADINDYKKFPAYPVQCPDQKFSFIETETPVHPTLPENYSIPGQSKGFDDFLEQNNTVAFLIIRNDSILYEKYFDGLSKESLLPSFSIVKSLVSALTGIAIEKGHIKSVDDAVTDYVGGFKNPGFEHIRIKHLLNMQSGIRFREGYANPFGEMAKFYYGRNLKKYTLSLKVDKAPGQIYEYQSANTQILSMVLEHATGLKIHQYLEQQIWRPLGMEYDASWNYDSKKHGNIKAFCCLNARAIDFAKFGKLYLDRGRWHDQQIISSSWIKETENASSQFADAAGYPYHYHWRIKNDGALFAKGILGQYIYIDRSKNVIIVRFGKKNGDIDWPSFFESLITQSL